MGINWGLLWGGIAAMVVVALACVLLVGSDAGNQGHNGIWAFLLVLPVAVPLAGALVLAGRDE